MGRITFVLGALPAGRYNIFAEELGDLQNLLQFDVAATVDSPITAASVSASGAPTFHVKVPVGINCVVQRTLDFKNWIDVTQLTGESDFTDQQPASDSPTFYRLKVPEVQTAL